MVALALVATGSAVAAYLTGKNFLNRGPELVLTGDAGARAVWEGF